MYGCCATEIFQQDAWKELKETAEKRGLAPLGDKARNLVMETHAESTVKGYMAAFAHWKKWAEENKFAALPAEGVAVTLYLIDLLERATTASPVVKAVAAIAWAHKKACVPSPVNGMVEQVVAAAKRKLAHKPRRKEPLKKEEAAKIVCSLLEDSDCLKLRTTVMVAVGFAGFLRWNDMEQLKVRDITFYEEYAEFRLGKRKNDQFRQGSVVLIERQSGAGGPVDLCERLIKTAKLARDDHLFANLVKTADGWRKKKGHLQYSRALELFKEAVGAAGLDAREYGLHSLRAGGTTAAAAEKVPERLLKRHGGWRSEAINNYVQESLDHLLAPSRATSWA